MEKLVQEKLINTLEEMLKENYNSTNSNEKLAKDILTLSENIYQLYQLNLLDRDGTGRIKRKLIINCLENATIQEQRHLIDAYRLLNDIDFIDIE